MSGCEQFDDSAHRITRQSAQQKPSGIGRMGLVVREVKPIDGAIRTELQDAIGRAIVKAECNDASNR